MSETSWVAIVGIIVAGFLPVLTGSIAFLVNRHLSRKDRRSEFRRQALIDFQDALLILVRVRFDHDAVDRPGPPVDAVWDANDEAVTVVSFHASRVSDKKLQELVKGFERHGFAHRALVDEVNERVAELFGEL